MSQLPIAVHHEFGNIVLKGDFQAYKAKKGDVDGSTMSLSNLRKITVNELETAMKVSAI